MLDSSLIQQLKTVFKKLENQVELVLRLSDHQKYPELEEMLERVASTSENVFLTKSEETSEAPSFYLQYKGQSNGIQFTGIPGGHEFTSLILAVLNSDGKGNLPDKGICERVKALKGPIRLKTFVSLSCENCPEVVQALNLMATLHPDFHHEMVDGEYAQEDVQSLGVQGVPSVFAERTLIDSGKTSFSDLLSQLERAFGTSDSLSQESKNLGEYDVLIIGGGPAGASSAIYTARKGLKTGILAERVGGQLQDTKGIENMISIPYTEGPLLTSKLVEHMSQYDIDVLEHRKVNGVVKGDIITLNLESGEQAQTKSLIVATGAKWKHLGIPGESEYLGRGVAFCPHCDGPYYKGKDIAVIGGGNSGVEAAIDLAGLVNSILLMEFNFDLKADGVLVEKVQSLSNVKIVTGVRSTAILGDGVKVTALEYEERQTGQNKKVQLDGIFVQIGLSPNSDFVKDIVETNTYGEIIVDEKCKTNVPGIYAAGDVTTTPYKQIVIAMSEGAKAGLAAFEDQMLGK